MPSVSTFGPVAPDVDPVDVACPAGCDDVESVGCGCCEPEPWPAGVVDVLGASVTGLDGLVVGVVGCVVEEVGDDVGVVGPVVGVVGCVVGVVVGLVGVVGCVEAPTSFTGKPPVVPLGAAFRVTMPSPVTTSDGTVNDTVAVPMFVG